MALLPEPIPTDPISSIDGCLGDFLTDQASDPESLAAITAVLSEMKAEADAQLQSIIPKIDGLTTALVAAQAQEASYQSLAGFTGGIRQGILDFRQDLLASQGVDCPELIALDENLGLFATSLTAKIASLNVSGTQDILDQLSGLRSSLEVQSSNLDLMLSFLGG